MSNNKNPTVGPQKAVEISGLKSDAMLIYLSRIDVLKPSGNECPGRGRERRFTFNDIVFLKAVAEMLKQGIEVKKLGQALRQAKRDSAQWMDIRRAPNRYLVTDGAEIFFTEAGRLESKNFNRQLAFGFVIDLRKIHRQIVAAWPGDLARRDRERLNRRGRGKARSSCGSR